MGEETVMSEVETGTEICRFSGVRPACLSKCPRLTYSN
jgi:hypothetical protein